MVVARGILRGVVERAEPMDQCSAEQACGQGVKALMPTAARVGAAQRPACPTLQ